MSYRRGNNLDKDIVWAEYFNDEQSVRKNGGTPTSIIFSQGKASFNGTSSYIAYKHLLDYNPCTIRIILTHADNDSSQDWVIDFGEDLCYVDVQSENVYRSSGTVYVNGIAGSTYTINETTEIVVTGFIVQGGYFRIGSVYDNTQFFEGTIELIEIYNRVLTAEEVSNLYNNSRYFAPILSHNEQLGENMIVNGGFEGTTDWIDTNGDGLADGFSTTNLSGCSIVTGNGFVGNAQRIEYDGATGAFTFSGLTIGKKYKISIKYRGNYLYVSHAITGQLLPQNLITAAEWNLTFISLNTTILFSATAAGRWGEVDEYKLQEVLVENISELLHITGQSGSLVSKYDYTIVDSGHSIKKDGNINTIFIDEGTDGIDINPVGSVEPETFAVLCWVKGLGNEGVSVDSIVSSTSGSAYGWGVAYNEITKKFRFAVDDDGTGAWDHGIDSDDAVNQNEWYFLVCTFNGTTMEMYINNVQQSGSIACSSVYYRVSHDPITIGKFRDGGAKFHGYINDVRIYEGILTTEELSQVWTSERSKYGK